MRKNETYLQWIMRRQAIAEARLKAMFPITPQSTPLLEYLRRQQKGS